MKTLGAGLNDIVMLSAPAVSLRIGNALTTCVRFGTPETTLGVIGSLVRAALPGCQICAYSLRRLQPGYPCHKKAVAYGADTIDVEFLGAPVEVIESDVRRAQVVLVTANLTQEAGSVAMVLKDLRRVKPGLLVLVGGTDATFRPEFYLEKGADMVVRGETEALLPDLLKRLSRGQDFTAVPNLAWRESGGGVSHSPMMRECDRDLWLPAPEDWVTPVLDEVTIGRQLIEGDPPEGVSSRSIYLETSRGCRPCDCGFCTTPQKTGGPKGYRRLSPQLLLKSLDSAARQGVGTLQIIDDNVLARCDEAGGEDEVFETFSLIRERGFAWEFPTGLQVSRLISKGVVRDDLLRSLFSPRIGQDGRLVGGYRLFLPLETLPANSPERYCRWSKMRGLNEEVAVAVLEGLDRAGVRMISLGVMIGFPDDTPKHIDAVVEGMTSLNGHIRRINQSRRASGVSEMEVHWDVMVYMLLPGTADYDTYRNRLLYPDDYYSHPELLNFQTAAYRPLHMSAEELTRIRHEIAQSFGSIEMPQTDGSTSHQYVAI